MYIYMYYVVLYFSSHFPSQKKTFFTIFPVFCGSQRGAQSKQTTERSKTNHPFLDAFDIAFDGDEADDFSAKHGGFNGDFMAKNMQVNGCLMVI